MVPNFSSPKSPKDLKRNEKARAKKKLSIHVTTTLEFWGIFGRFWPTKLTHPAVTEHRTYRIKFQTKIVSPEPKED